MCINLLHSQICGSNKTAVETANLLRTVISSSRWSNAKNLLQTIQEITEKLVQAQPVEFAVGNVARRIMRLIKEEYKGISNVASTGHQQGSYHSISLSSPSPSSSSGHNNTEWMAENNEVIDVMAEYNRLEGLQNVPGSRISVTSTASDSSMYNLLAQPEAEIDYSRQLFSLKQSIIQAVNELIEELESVGNQIAAQAIEYIHANEVILTVGKSKTVEQFLKAAARKRSFQVIVIESSPSCSGHEMAANLTASGIDSLLVSDAAVFAMMSRVNKVIIGCHAVTANGGIIARNGTRIAAACAKHYSTPVCVVTGMYKITPIFPENHADFNLLAAPDMVVPFSDSTLVDSNVEILNPQFDYVPSSLISILITNQGGNPPSYVYRLLGELYDTEDYNADKPLR
jgi:translation initiation factor eIF-2B subunit beta